MRLFELLKIIIAFFSAVSCASMPSSDQKRNVGSVVEPLTAWSQDKLPIETCFGFLPRDLKLLTYKNQEVAQNVGGVMNGLAFKTFQKEHIVQVLTEEFSKERTGVFFTGFRDCNESPEAKIMVVPLNTLGTGGYSIIGEQGLPVAYFLSWKYKKFREPGMQIITIRYWPTQQIYDEIPARIITIHEFGHAVSLVHEGLRKEDAAKDPYCAGFGDTLNSEKKSASARYSSEYDPNSIMNYCFTQTLIGFDALEYRYKTKEGDIKFPIKDSNQFKETIFGEETHVKIHIGLSEKDVHALKCLYVDGYSKNNSCN